MKESSRSEKWRPSCRSTEWMAGPLAKWGSVVEKWVWHSFWSVTKKPSWWSHVKPLEWHLSSFSVRLCVGTLRVWNRPRGTLWEGDMFRLEHDKKDSGVRACVDPILRCIRATTAEPCRAAPYVPSWITFCTFCFLQCCSLHVSDWRSSSALEEKGNRTPLLLLALISRNLAVVDLNNLSWVWRILWWECHRWDTMEWE